MTGGGLKVTTVAVLALSALFGSKSDALTTASFTIGTPVGSAQEADATRVTDSLAPPPISSNDTVRSAPEPPHTPPPVAAQDTNDSADGRRSSTSTARATSGR